MAGERDVLAEALRGIKGPHQDYIDEMAGTLAEILAARGYTLSRSGAPWDWDEATMAAQAAPSPEPLPLDVERLARAIERACQDHNEECWFRRSPEMGATAIAREYAALREDRPT